MIRPLVIAALATALVGCSTITQEQVLKNLQGCERHYLGTVSGGITGSGFSGAVRIDCNHSDGSTEPVPATPPTNNPLI